MSKGIIKPTPAMRQAITSVPVAAVDGALAGVIEIIERNYLVQPRCTERLGEDMRCSLAAGHDGNMHLIILPNGTRITFENLVDNSTGSD